MFERMKNIFNESSKGFRVMLLMIYDMLAVLACEYLSLLVRFEFSINKIPAEYSLHAAEYLVFNMTVTLIVFAVMQLYDSLWRYASVRELFSLAIGCIITSLIQLAGMTALGLDMPRSYYVLYLFFFLTLSVMGRFSYRVLRIWRHSTNKNPAKKHIRTMIVGAGDAGVMLINEIKTSYKLNDQILCIIDDNPAKIGNKIHGIPIVGNRHKIPEAVEKYGIEQIIIAIPTIRAKDKKEITNICKDTGCHLRILPGIYQIVKNEVSVSNLRDVRIEDLLGREPIRVEMDLIMDYVKDQVVLVTGGGGSIGSELCRQIAAHQPKQLILFDIYENSTYEIQLELKKKYPELDLVVLIGSVRNTHRVETMFAQYRPDLVYHAAAHKHVPLMEDSPNEAIKNNVIGTYNVAAMADKYGTKRFVLISTDKAVNPTNIMGASKRLCEMVVQMMNRESNTEFVAVRFGNVLGSNGSVIPLFKKQIEAGGPVTVTHPDIIRYFMTIPEAVSLVLQAGFYAKGGEIFVLDMGEPVKIDTMARNLIRLSGFEPDVDIEVKYTGLRPGEKLYEELLMKEEGLQDTENKLIHIGKPIEMDDELFKQQLRRLEQAYKEETTNMKEIVAEIVPTYKVTPNK